MYTQKKKEDGILGSIFDVCKSKIDEKKIPTDRAVDGGVKCLAASKVVSFFFFF